MASSDYRANRAPKVTAVAAHLSCRHLTQLERQRSAGEIDIPLYVDPHLKALQQRGLEHENGYVERLRAQGLEICDLRQSRRMADTADAMARGYGAIVQAPLQSDVLSGVADVLLRVGRPSKLGAYSYEPVETKLARETRASTLLQLCAYGDFLTEIQGVSPEHLHVITPRADERYRSDQLGAYFRLVRRQFLTAVTQTPAPATYPDPVAHCDVCSFWKYCDGRRRVDDHPSLVADIRTLQVREFQRQGLTTLAAIAGSQGRLPSEPSRGSPLMFARLGQQAKLQLQARAMAVPPFEFLPVEMLRGFTRLPEPSASDLFLDFEGDPFVGDQGLEYLTGYVTRDSTGGLALGQKWAWDAADEKSAAEWFIDFAIGRLREDPRMHIYHFGAYEPAALKRLCARYGTRGEELDQLLRGGRFVDLHAIVREAMRIGVERYGLKELEALHGFSRKLDLRTAGTARSDLELALELGDSRTIPKAMLEQVAAYNGEDCFSTESLRTWLERRRELLVAQGQAIPRPPLQPVEASDAVSERDERISALRAALLASVPTEVGARTNEQSARALLASMLGYFRQEEKNAWWEHFRLREVPVADQLDEREMLAGLRFVETLPKAPRERNARLRFSFPPQDTAVAADDKNYYYTKAEDPSGGDKSTSVKVAELDLARGFVVLSMGKDAQARMPSAIFREQVVGAKPLEESLLDFAESVCDGGFQTTGRYAAAASLLLRRKPLEAMGEASLRREEEPLLEAAKRLSGELSRDALPIQGPPGSGKTYTGAHTILALAKAGKRIGITAVSHKVIDNLLVAVGRAAAADPAAPTIRVVHKDDGEELAPGVEYVPKSAAALAAIDPGAIVGGTAWLWADKAAGGSLDYLFIDEAGQMSLAQALAAARAARNIVLLGDPQQLEQPRKGSHPEGADIAALVHLVGKERPTIADDQGLFLDSTYRLHPAICGFTSELYYENRLRPTAGLQLQTLQGDTPFAGAGLFLVEVRHEGNQAQSQEEVKAVAAIVESILKDGVSWTDRHEKTRPIQATDILVVAPYNAQVGALSRELGGRGVRRVGTVDKFQGQEAPIVIYSCTSSSPQDAPRGMPFLYDPHRFNVATSRAQGLVIVVASPALFEPDCRTPEQMLWANGLCRYRELAKAVVP